mmetsp:Transcript_2803/g.7519  ORF Transcript_2803/g.7519 Transcript_2803/m.7519 type:complete len:405 (+) Transcript_2803:191-1405(+)
MSNLARATQTRRHHADASAGSRLRARELLPAKLVLQSIHISTLLVVSGSTMTTLNVLVIGRCCSPCRVCKHPGDHLARVPRVHSVVLRGGDKEDGRVRCRVRDVVIRGVLVQEVVPVLVGVAVLAHPGSTCQKLVELPHVQQRHLADEGPEQLPRAPREHVADQQTPVGPAAAGETLPARDAPRDEVLRDGLEVLVALAAVALLRALVPLWPVLAAAADVRIHPHPTLLEPGGPAPAAVGRRQADLKTTVAVQKRLVRAVQLHTLLADLEVGYLGAVLGRREVLLNLQVPRLEKVRQGLQREAVQQLPFEEGLDRGQVEAGRADVARDRGPQLVGVVLVHGAEVDALHAVARLVPSVVPRSRPVLPHLQLRLHVAEQPQNQEVQRPALALERLRLGGLEENGDG